MRYLCAPLLEPCCIACHLNCSGRTSYLIERKTYERAAQWQSESKLECQTKRIHVEKKQLSQNVLMCLIWESLPPRHCPREEWKTETSKSKSEALFEKLQKQSKQIQTGFCLLLQRAMFLFTYQWRLFVFFCFRFCFVVCLAMFIALFVILFTRQ